MRPGPVMVFTRRTAACSASLKRRAQSLGDDPCSSGVGERELGGRMSADLIRSFYEAFSRRDAEGMVASYADDVRFSDPGLHGFPRRAREAHVAHALRAREGPRGHVQRRQGRRKPRLRALGGALHVRPHAQPRPQRDRRELRLHGRQDLGARRHVRSPALDRDGARPHGQAARMDAVRPERAPEGRSPRPRRLGVEARSSDRAPRADDHARRDPSAAAPRRRTRRQKKDGSAIRGSGSRQERARRWCARWAGAYFFPPTLAFLSPWWPWNVRVGANSPSLCPTMFSVTNTGMNLRPL